MSSCVVHVDKGPYYPGKTIVGRVVCSFDSSTDVRGITVTLRGREHIKWREDSYIYTGENILFVVEITVAEEGVIEAGRYEYPFTFNLPRDIPETFQNEYGWIKFSVKATVDGPGKLNCQDEKEFFVVSPIDLNEIRGTLLLDPIAYSDNVTLRCCCCCANGPVTMNVHLEKEAFTQGETVRVKVKVINKMNKDVQGVRAEMCMKIDAKIGEWPIRTGSRLEVLATASDRGVEPHGERTYNFNLEIPKSPTIPNFRFSQLFSSRTTIKVSAKILGYDLLEIETVPIIIGHIPLAAGPSNTGQK